MGLTERLGSLSSVLSFGMPLPHSQSVCGGIMTLSLLPALIILLSVGVVGDFYASNRGAMSETTIEALRPGFGIELNGEDPRRPKQALLCLADSGCWYTRFADNECPSVDIIQSLVRNSDHISALAHAALEGVPATDERPGPTIRKECAYAPKNAVLEGSCLYYSADPIDALTITWRKNAQTGSVSAHSPSPKMGVALVTDFIRRTETEDTGMQDAFDYAEYARKVLDVSSWKTVGGGEGYKLIEYAGWPLHYGAVSLQILEGIYENMPGGRTAVTKLTPTFQHTDHLPTGTNICIDPHGGASPVAEGPDAKCAPAGSCLQLKVSPAPFKIVEHEWTTTSYYAFVGLIGGYIGLIVLILKYLHALTLAVGEATRCYLCAPLEGDGEPPARSIGDKVVVVAAP